LAQRVPYNPKGCWDWWGYTDSQFPTKNGKQIVAISKMIARLSESGTHWSGFATGRRPDYGQPSLRCQTRYDTRDHGVASATEVNIEVHVLNRTLALGRPSYVRIGW